MLEFSVMNPNNQCRQRVSQMLVVAIALRGVPMASRWIAKVTNNHGETHLEI